MLSRRTLVAGLFLGSVLGPAFGQDGEKSSRASKSVTAPRRFNQRVFSSLVNSSGKKNVVFSPYSVGTTLDLLTLGADGKTLDLLVKARGVDLEAMTKRPTVPQIISSLSTDELILRLATSVWLRPGVRTRPTFAIAAKAIFDAQVTTADFTKVTTVDAINGWVNNSTGGLIQRVVDALDPETEFVIGNIAYFKGKWSVPFDKAQTVAGPFMIAGGGVRQVPLMRSTVRAPYLQKDDWHALALPYKGDKLDMVIVTAIDVRDSAAVRKKVLSANFVSSIAVSYFSERSAAVVCPRFKAEFGIDLTGPLGRLGLQKVFNGRANFGQITPAPIEDIAVLHRAVVEVNEEGTEAAAATTVITTREVSMPVAFNADRPFAFFIRDRESGDIFFQGYIHDPAS